MEETVLIGEYSTADLYSDLINYMCIDEEDADKADLEDLFTTFYDEESATELVQVAINKVAEEIQSNQ